MVKKIKYSTIKYPTIKIMCIVVNDLISTIKLKIICIVVNDLGLVWYVYLKTENYCLKTFVKIRVGKKIC